MGKSNNNTISVIVPVYNVEDYLSECIESVLNQTYSNLEIILVDDGSTDKSKDMCDQYAKEDSRIIVVHQRNKGQSDARNHGLEKATGDYIAFADSDDVLHPKLFEHLILALQETDSDLSICHEVSFSEEVCPFQDYDQVIIENVENKQELFAHFMENWTGPINFFWNKLFPRQLLDGLRFPTNRKMEDMYLAPEVMSRVSKAVWIDERLYGYRQREGSTMNSGQDIIYRFWAEAIEHQRDVFHKVGNAQLMQQYDAYALKTLASIQLQAQKAGLNDGYNMVRHMFRKLYRETDTKSFSIKDKCIITIAFYAWYFYRLLKK